MLLWVTTQQRSRPGLPIALPTHSTALGARPPGPQARHHSTPFVKRELSGQKPWVFGCSPLGHVKSPQFFVSEHLTDCHLGAGCRQRRATGEFL